MPERAFSRNPAKSARSEGYRPAPAAAVAPGLGRLSPGSDPTGRIPPLQLQRLIGNRAVSRMLAPVQRKYELCSVGDVTYTPDNGRAGKVVAQNIKGISLGAAANSPSVEPFGWGEMWNEGHTLGNTQAHSSHYNAVRMHLMNGRLGGPGDNKLNLAPGPALINSQMSAGPETAAKMLADAGYRVWLETTVSYQSNSNNAANLTAVVPNHIEMKWGTGTYPANPTSWSADIPLPVDPLQGAEAAKYKNWTKSAAALVVDLQSKTPQVRAQVFELVPTDALRLAILHAYPATYMSMTDPEKGKIVNSIPSADLPAFFAALGVNGDPDSFAREILLPLGTAGHSAKAEQLFATWGHTSQRLMLVSYKLSLLQYLGDEAKRWSIEDSTIFQYNSGKAQARLLAGLTIGEVKELLSQFPATRRVLFLDKWADVVGKKTSPAARQLYIETRTTIPDKYKKEFEAWTRRQIEREQVRG